MGKITTYSGLFVDPFNLKPEQVTIVDIAYALHNISRFGGHTIRRYSVAEHSLIGALYLDNQGTKAEALGFLLHDAPEAYLGIDIPAPYKHLVEINGEPVSSVERRIAAVIMESLGLAHIDWLGDIKVATMDSEMLKIELPALTRHWSPPPENNVGVDYFKDSNTVPESFINVFQRLCSELTVVRP